MTDQTTLAASMSKTENAPLVAVIQDYFDGLYEGDIEKLTRIFHEDTYLKGNQFRSSRDQWLAAVATRAVPSEQGMAYGFEILSMDIEGDMAMVKLEVPLLAAHFIDYLGLLKEDGEWKIVNKMFTTV